MYDPVSVVQEFESFFRSIADSGVVPLSSQDPATIAEENPALCIIPVWNFESRMISLTNKVIIFAFLLWLLAGNCFAQDDSDPSEELMANRHRLDFSLNFLDSAFDNSLGGTFGYAYNLTQTTNFSAAVNYLDSRLDSRGGSGFGDTSLAFSWAPAVNLSVAPWVPRKIGSGLGIILPTGNAADGRGSDATILTPFVGLVFPITDNFYLYPTLSYLWSADKIITGEDISIGVVDLGAGWIPGGRFWVTVYAAIVRDFDTDDSHFNNQISLGLNLSEQWSGSFDYVNSDFFLPGSDSQVGIGIDKQLVLSLHFNF
jgi:hypothetical protein